MAQFHHLNSRQRFYLILSLTSIMILILIFLIILPNIKEIKQLSINIYDQRVELEKLYMKGKIIKQTLKDYASIKPELQTLNQIYVTRGNELNFITALEGIAETQKLEQKITLNTESLKNNTILPLELSINGNLPTFINYLGGVEGLDYYVSIESIRLTGQTNGNGKQTITGLLSANTYYK